MADDALSKFTRSQRGNQPTASASHPLRQQERVPERDGDEYEPQVRHQVRPVCVELRCHRNGLSYSIPYAHLGAIVFNFRTGRELSFTGAGFGVTLRGRDLSGVARGLRLHACSVIEDAPEGDLRPIPSEPDTAFVESIEVKVLHARPQEKERAKDREEV